MKKWVGLLVGLFCVVLAGCAPRYTFQMLQTPEPDTATVAVELFLIGDAGLPNAEGEPVLLALERMLRRNPARSLVIFLGDNLYPSGLPDSAAPYREEGERIIQSQMKVVENAGARGMFIPGNHDWDAGGPLGWQKVVRQERFIDREEDEQISFVPSYGCPGPEVFDLGQAVRLVVLDTQWWLHQGPKPQGSSTPCAAGSRAEVEAALAAALRDTDGLPVVVLGHHPLESGGHHGEYFEWPHYLSAPFSVARMVGFADQDITSPRYRGMRKALRRAFRENPPLVYAAGHEHNLQVLSGRGARYNLVSGGGIFGHVTPLRTIRRTRYAREASGFMRLSVLRNGRVRLGVVVVDESGMPTEDFSMWLDSNARAD